MDFHRLHVRPGRKVTLRRYDPADTRPFHDKRKATGVLDRGLPDLILMDLTLPEPCLFRGRRLPPPLLGFAISRRMSLREPARGGQHHASLPASHSGRSYREPLPSGAQLQLCCPT